MVKELIWVVRNFVTEEKRVVTCKRGVRPVTTSEELCFCIGGK